MNVAEIETLQVRRILSGGIKSKKVSGTVYWQWVLRLLPFVSLWDVQSDLLMVG